MGVKTSINRKIAIFEINPKCNLTSRLKTYSKKVEKEIEIGFLGVQSYAGAKNSTNIVLMKNSCLFLGRVSGKIIIRVVTLTTF